MGIGQSFRDIFISSPRNIKRRLFRDILFVLLCTSTIIVGIALLQGNSTKKEISAKLIDESVQLIKNRFEDIFRPIEHNLSLVSKWGESGLIDFDKPESSFKIIRPILQINPEITSISIITEEKQSITFSNNDGVIETHTLQMKTKAPHTPVWFEEATTKDTPSIYWTELYLDEIVNDKVVTGTTFWLNSDNKTKTVVAITISIKKILHYIDETIVPNNMDVVIINKAGRTFSRVEEVIENSQVHSNSTPKKYSNARNQAIKLWQNQSYNSDQAIFFKSDGISWWAGFSPLRSEQLNWLGIILPESLIIKDVRDKWLSIGIIGASVFLLGLILTTLLVRKYSFQLRDLPLQSIKRESFIHDLRRLIDAGESTNVEFKSTIRTNLQTGKVGKEIEIAWLKTVAAFMNSDGGILIFGVKDNGKMVGIEADSFKSVDKCLLHVKNLISTHIGAEFSRYIHVKTGSIDQMCIIAIECERIRKPVFLKIGKTEDYFIRSGPSSVKLSMSQMVKYMSNK